MRKNDIPVSHVLDIMIMFISSIEEILADFKKGQFVIMVDSPNRENEGDLMLAAEHINGSKINFMLKEARGMICLALTEKQAKLLELPMMQSSKHGSERNHAAFTYSIEATKGVTTGISASERAHTMQTAISCTAKATDVVTPGHVFPIVAKNGGVLTREGHTEAGVDIASLCGLNKSAVLCEILDEEGNAASNSFLKWFAEKHRIRIGSVTDLVHYRKSVHE